MDKKDDLKIRMVQLNTTLGDFQRQSENILRAAKEAEKNKVDLLVFPELTLFGYPPGDLLERESIVEKQNDVFADLITKLPSNVGCLFGYVEKNQARGKPYFNSAALVHNNKIQKSFRKQLLPVYDVFDDSRHFEPGLIADNFFEFQGHRILVLICEDMWGWDELHPKNPLEEVQQEKVDAIINLSASPFTKQKFEMRKAYGKKTCELFRAPLFYTNMMGAQDELVFDGGSFVMTANGEIIKQAPFFEESIIEVSVDSILSSKGHPSSSPAQNKNLMEDIQQALMLGLKDYARKTGFQKVHLGLSGGIDSAVVAALACEALGGKNVSMIAMPTEYNASLSMELAKALAKNYGSPFFEMPIQDNFKSLVASYEKAFGNREFSFLHENIQARLRGLLLMAFANDNNSLLLSTGNKSEYATGYTTLYGDMCGGLAVIGDLLKGEVYGLARHINKSGDKIPQGIIDRPPSAELRPNQKDSDSLPAYDELDLAVQNLVSQKAKAQSKTEEWVLKRLMLSEFKRWQAPPVLKISSHGFGQGRRMPIAHKAWY